MIGILTQPRALAGTKQHHLGVLVELHVLAQQARVELGVDGDPLPGEARGLDLMPCLPPTIRQ